MLERYEYGDYGLPKVLAPDGTTVREYSLIADRIGFTGRSWYPELDLADYRFCWMEPRVGRFIQRDPMGYIDAMNLYAYVSSSPSTFRDPFGLWIWDAIPVVSTVRCFLYKPSGANASHYASHAVTQISCQQLGATLAEYQCEQAIRAAAMAEAAKLVAPRLISWTIDGLIALTPAAKLGLIDGGVYFGCTVWRLSQINSAFRAAKAQYCNCSSIQPVPGQQPPSGPSNSRSVPGGPRAVAGGCGNTRTG